MKAQLGLPQCLAYQQHACAQQLVRPMQAGAPAHAGRCFQPTSSGSSSSSSHWLEQHQHVQQWQQQRCTCVCRAGTTRSQQQQQQPTAPDSAPDWSHNLLKLAKSKKKQKKSGGSSSSSSGYGAQDGADNDVFPGSWQQHQQQQQPWAGSQGFDDADADGDEWAGDDMAGGKMLVDKKKLPAAVRCFDTARIYVKGGDGGAGCVAFRREPYVEKGGPNGGNGGKGGNVWAVADEGLNSLLSFRNQLHYRAGPGSAGGSD